MEPRRAVALRVPIVLLLLLGSVARGDAELLPCRQPSDPQRVSEALARLRAAADPCGESGEVTAVLDALAGCATARYEICVTAAAERNLFDRPNTRDGVRTILWNPDLSSELEPRCDENHDPVRREPAASLLHEIVHAAHDCAGLDPGQHELEAVRIENIYRRAAGLRQRTAYGTDPLPAPMRRLCAAGACSCGVPGADAATAELRTPIRVGPIADASDPVR
jgi:hypothetical protein